MNSWIAAVNAVSSVWLDAILRAAWQGAIALTLVWIVSRRITALPANYKVWLWRLAFLKLLVALVWVTPVSLPVLPTKEQTASVTTSLPARISQPIELVAQTSPPIFAATEVRLEWRSWLLALWSIVVIWALARIAQHWHAAKTLLRNSDLITDTAFNDILLRLAKELRLRNTPTIHQSPLISSPVLIGVFRPRIILPMGFNCHAHIDLMLAHELAHICRRDLCWQWLFTLCETVFFFHPFVWLARREWTLSTEAACDQLALRVANRAPHDYGSMLVEVVARMSGRRAPVVMGIGMFETANTLKRRLKAMSTKRTWFSTAAGIVLITVATLALVPCRLVAETADAETMARLKEENAKLKQELEVIRKSMEDFRRDEQRMRTRVEFDKTMHAAKQDLEELQRGFENGAPELEQYQSKLAALAAIHADLQVLLSRFTHTHPDVIAKFREFERLKTELQRRLRNEPERYLEQANSGLKSRMARVPATAEQIARSREHRALLAREIELAEKQAEFVRKNLEAGKEIAENLLRVHREVLELKLQQAELSGSKAERMAVLSQQLQVAQDLLKEQQKRIKVGTLPPGAEIPFEREVLRLQRQLASPW